MKYPTTFSVSSPICTMVANSNEEAAVAQIAYLQAAMSAGQMTQYAFRVERATIIDRVLRLPSDEMILDKGQLFHEKKLRLDAFNTHHRVLSNFGLAFQQGNLMFRHPPGSGSVVAQAPVPASLANAPFPHHPPFWTPPQHRYDFEQEMAARRKRQQKQDPSVLKDPPSQHQLQPGVQGGGATVHSAYQFSRFQNVAANMAVRRNTQQKQDVRPLQPPSGLKHPPSQPPASSINHHNHLNHYHQNGATLDLAHGAATVNSSLSGLSQFPVTLSAASLNGTMASSRSNYVDVAGHPLFRMPYAKIQMEIAYQPYSIKARSGGTKNIKNYKCADCSGPTFQLRLVCVPAHDGPAAQSETTFPDDDQWRLQIHCFNNQHHGHPLHNDPGNPGRSLHPSIRRRLEDLRVLHEITGTKCKFSASQYMMALLQYEDTKNLPQLVSPQLTGDTRRQIQNHIFRKQAQTSGNRPRVPTHSVDDIASYIRCHQICIPNTYNPEETFSDPTQFAAALGYSTSSHRLCLKTPTVEELESRLGITLRPPDVFRIASSIIYTSPGMLYTLYQFAVNIAPKNKAWSADGTWVLKDGSVLVTFGAFDMAYRKHQRRVTRSLRPFSTVKCPGGESGMSVVIAAHALELLACQLWGEDLAVVIQMILSRYVSIDKSKPFASGFSKLNNDIGVLVCYRHVLALFGKDKPNWKKFHDSKYCETHAIEHLQLLNRCKSRQLFENCFPFVMKLWRDHGEHEAATAFEKGYGPLTKWFRWYLGSTRSPNMPEDKVHIPDSQPHEAYYSKVKPKYLKKSNVNDFLVADVDTLLQYNALFATGCDVVAPKGAIQRNLLDMVSMLDPTVDMYHHIERSCWYVNCHQRVGTPITAGAVDDFESLMLGCPLDTEITSDNVLEFLEHVRDLCRVRYIKEPSVKDLHYQCTCKVFSLQMECAATMLVKDSLHMYNPPLAASFLPASQKSHRSPTQLGPYVNEATILAANLSLACLHPYYMRFHIRGWESTRLKQMARYRCLMSSRRVTNATRAELLPLLLCYRTGEVRLPTNAFVPASIAGHPMIEDAEEPPVDGPFWLQPSSGLLHRVDSFDGGGEFAVPTFSQGVPSFSQGDQEVSVFFEKFGSPPKVGRTATKVRLEGASNVAKAPDAISLGSSAKVGMTGTTATKVGLHGAKLAKAASAKVGMAATKVGPNGSKPAKVASAKVGMTATTATKVGLHGAKLAKAASAKVGMAVTKVGLNGAEHAKAASAIVGTGTAASKVGLSGAEGDDYSTSTYSEVDSQYSPTAAIVRSYLFVGDVVEYQPGIGVWGADRLFQAKILGINPSAPLFPLNLDSGHLVANDQFVKRLSRGSTGFKTLGTHFTFEEDGTQSLVGLKRTAAQITQVRAEAIQDAELAVFGHEEPDVKTAPLLPRVLFSKDGEQGDKESCP
jgi:hypothetical protein